MLKIHLIFLKKCKIWRFLNKFHFFENDELRNELSIKSLKLDANYKAFFEKLANGDEAIINQVKQAFEGYIRNKNISYKFKLESKEIILNPCKIIEFLEEKTQADQVSCPDFLFRSARVKSNKSTYQLLEGKLSGKNKEEFKASFDKARNATNEIGGNGLEGARADVVFPAPVINSMR